jgi:hypothetical protein
MIQEAIDQGLLAAIWTRPVRRLQRAPVKAGRNGPKSAVSRLVWGVNVAFGINVLDQRMVRRVTCLLPSVDPADRGGARALIRELVDAFESHAVTAVDDASSLEHYLFEAIHRDVRPAGLVHFGRAADFLALSQVNAPSEPPRLPAGDFVR